MVNIIILPQKKKVYAEIGTVVLDVLEKNGIFLNTRCGRKGICGKCRVKLNGTDVLSCLTTINQDSEIFIPETSKLDDIYSKTTFSHEASAIRYVFNPQVKKIYLKISHYLENPIGDWEKIVLALRDKYPDHEITTPIENLRKLGKLIRESRGEVTLTVFENSPWRLSVLRIECGNTVAKNYAIAVDIGTTTVLVYLVDLTSGQVIDAKISYNKQIIYGEDVITRIIFTESQKDGLEILHNVLVEVLNDLISALVRSNKITTDDINCIAVAGNTTMTHILYKIYPEYIRKEPYVPVVSFAPDYYANKFGIKVNEHAILISAPCVSAYVGGDITAGVIATDITSSKELSLLVDIGTNGEIVVGNSEFLVCASCSAGPAFEGVGIRSGIHAVSGAISRVAIENEKLKYETIGAQKPKGICGSGLIDLLSELLKSGIIDPSGKFNKKHPNVRKYELPTDTGYEFVVEYAQNTSSGEDIVLTETDIANLIRSKGAVYLGMEVLLKEMGFNFNDLKKIYIAGGFGNYLDIQKAITIGLLPDLPLEKFEFIGNSSIAGARLILISSEARNLIKEVAKKMTYIDLSRNPYFMNEYTSTLFLPHTNMELFSSVKRWLEGK